MMSHHENAPLVTARKPHTCQSCRRVVQPGQQYYRGASLCMDDFPPRRVETIVCCLACAAGDDGIPPFIPPRFVVYRTPDE